jgi:ryanodine receptor 2
LSIFLFFLFSFSSYLGVNLPSFFFPFFFQVPLVIFKREKEIARLLEFEGLYIVDQPSDDDVRAQWDKLVLSTASFPESYWDKFVKKKVST